MEIKIIAFGQIADITASKEWKLSGVKSTDEVRKLLSEQYPILKELNYIISVNKRIVNQDTPLTDQAEVALLPPFSGG